MKIAVWFKNKIKSFDFFELGNSVILYYFFIFYLSSILFFVGIRGFLWETSDVYYKALFYLTIGLIFFAIGYYNRQTFSVVRRLPDFLKLKSEWDFKKVPWVFGVVFVLGLGIKILRIFGGAYSYWQQNSWLEKNSFYSLLGIFDWLSYVALIIAFISYFYFKKNNDARYHLWQKIAWGVFILEMIYALPSCNRTFVAMPIILYLIVRSYFSRITWRQIIIIAMGTVIILFPLGNACRNPKILSHYSLVEKPLAEKSIKNIENSLAYIKNAGNFTFNSIFSRIDQFAIFSRIIEMNEPFLYGKPLLNFFISLGPPRFIWTNKPIISGGGDFGHRSGLLAPDVKSTVGVTIIGDWYMNFGLAGIIFGMFFMGMLFRLIYEYFIKRTEISLSGVMIYSILWLNIIKGMEDWIAPVYAGLVKIFILLLIIHYFLIKREKELKTV
ncbi:MAG: O-antigen polymerase [Patescibacteria group bacterium]